MRLYFLVILVFSPMYSMITPKDNQDPQVCPIIRLPLSVTAHILSYVIPACNYPGGFFLGRTRKARNFLTTCKYYHTSKELTCSIIAQLAQEYSLTKAFVFAPLYLATPTAYTCLQEWLQTTSEVKIILCGELITSEEKMKFLDAFLKNLTDPANPSFYPYTTEQKNHICSKIMAIKSLAQQIA